MPQNGGKKRNRKPVIPSSIGSESELSSTSGVRAADSGLSSTSGVHAADSGLSSTSGVHAADSDKVQDAVAKYGEVSRMLDVMEELETNYTDMLHMFMNISRRMLENASFVQGMMDVVKDIDSTHINRMTGVRVRLQEALTSVNDDFVKQTETLLSDPTLSDALKKKIREVRGNTERLADLTSPRGEI
nr:hypothetical protein TetV2_00286 [Oceanusvirus sp.]